MTSPAEADRRLALSYAPARARAGLAALLALDDALGAVLRGVREPIVAQMRMTWWHDALGALDDRPTPAQPVLRALAVDVLPRVAGRALQPMVEGWEELLDAAPMSDDALQRYADRRGGVMFDAMAVLLGVRDAAALRAAGRAWALHDLAAHSSEPGLSQRARALADSHAAAVPRLPPNARAAGAMLHLARLDAARGGRRLGRLVFHRLTGL